MNAVDLAMDSEKEEAVTSLEEVEVHQEEAIPGSSPEGVFPTDERQMFDSIESNDIAPRQIPLQIEELKHGEEIVEEQNELLEQTDQIGEILEEDTDQPFMNMVQITQDDVYEAGFDVEDLNHLTEEQLNIVVAISQQRQAKQSDQAEAGGAVDVEGHHHIMHHGMIGNEFDGGDGPGGERNDYETDDGHAQMIENDMQIILTNDGGVNITDSKQRQVYISPTEIANLNIDLNNFNHDHVQQLLQFALPSIKETDEKGEPVSYSRDVLDQAPSTSYHHHHHDQVGREKDPRNPMIGETVQIRTPDGRLQEAIVKYVRGNSDFKIQFMDGEFAYATVDQMLVPQRSRGQEGYHMEAPMLIRRTDMARLTAQKRAAGAGDELCPPVLKRSYQLAPVVDNPHVIHTPNFCCPICDKKVFQKEPSYIVIRLPACDSCTREKIIVLDEQNS